MGCALSKPIRSARRSKLVRTTAIDRTVETAHERSSLGANRKLTSGIGFNDPHTLDAVDGDPLSPIAPAHGHLSVVDAEYFYLDDSVSDLRLKLWEL